jgi:DNA-binding MarR family transcriptional regulator
MDENLAFEIAETARLLRVNFDRRAAQVGATRAQWRMLVRLAREDGQRQVDLAEALDVEPITVCRMVDRLADSGLVERRADSGDRRAWRIYLTGKATPVVADLSVLAEDFGAQALEGVSEDEQAAVRKILRVVRTNLTGRGSTARRAS